MLTDSKPNGITMFFDAPTARILQAFAKRERLNRAQTCDSQLALVQGGIPEDARPCR